MDLKEGQDEKRGDGYENNLRNLSLRKIVEKGESDPQLISEVSNRSAKHGKCFTQGGG